MKLGVQTKRLAPKKTAQCVCEHVLRFLAISLRTYFQLIHAQNETKSKLFQTSP